MGKFVRPLQGEILRESRSNERRTLRLPVELSSSDDWAQVLIQDLSEGGLMFETSVELDIGEIVSVDLPFIGDCEARIVWLKGTTYGSAFMTPISRAMVSVALLQAPGELARSEVETIIEEMPLGIKPSLEEMTKWKIEFERTWGATGYRLVGFRQAPDGMTIAMVTKTN